jgi:hypothetical protein
MKFVSFKSERICVTDPIYDECALSIDEVWNIIVPNADGHAFSSRKTFGIFSGLRFLSELNWIAGRLFAFAIDWRERTLL